MEHWGGEVADASHFYADAKDTTGAPSTRIMRDAISNRISGPLVLSGAIASFTLLGFVLAPQSSHAENARVTVYVNGTMNNQGVTFEVIGADKPDAGLPLTP